MNAPVKIAVFAAALAAVFAASLGIGAAVGPIGADSASEEGGHSAAHPDVEVYAEVPSSANYRLYLDFRHPGVVRTAAFAVPASQPEAEANTELA